LAQFFLDQFRVSHPEKRLEGFSGRCLKTLQSHTWPGNVRELRNALERAAILSSGSFIEVEALPESITARSERTDRKLISQTGRAPDGLPEDTGNWPRTRLAAEIEMAIEAKRHVQTYKRGQWKAEFMRLMYPHCKAANAKGFDDLIKRLTQGPWGDPKLKTHTQFARLISELES
jgi:DNA-binding NtrC family response regulator